MKLDVSINLNENTLILDGIELHASNYEEACLAFDKINQLRDDFNRLDCWADSMIDHLGKFPRMPSCANAARAPTSEGERKP